MTIKKIIVTSALALSLAACGSETETAAEVEVAEETPTVDLQGDAPAVSFKPDMRDPSLFIGKPSGPVKIAHRLVGKPVVGQPITLELKLMSIISDAPIQVEYRIPDGTALEIPADQPRSVDLALGADGKSTGHQLTLVPLRDGRIFLNVSASVQTPEGIMSSVTAIPLQVGDAPRELQENGTVVETESGELVRSLPAKQ